MVAGVIVRIAGQNVEDQAGEQISKRRGCIRKFMTDNFGQVFIAGVASHHFIQPQKGKRGYHTFSLPTLPCIVAVKTLDEQYVLFGRFGQRNRGGVESDKTGKPHGNEFRFYNVI